MRSLIDPGHPELSIVRQCELLGLARSTYYYEPASETVENLGLMQLIDALYTRRPFLGSRKMVTELAREHGIRVNRKRVQRLMRLMGIESVLPGPRTTKLAPEHVVYPYLLRNVVHRVLQHLTRSPVPRISYPRTGLQSEPGCSSSHIGLPQALSRQWGPPQGASRIWWGGERHQ